MPVIDLAWGSKAARARCCKALFWGLISFSQVFRACPSYFFLLSCLLCRNALDCHAANFQQDVCMWFVHKVSNLIWTLWFSNPLVNHLIPHVMAKLSMFFGKYAGTFRHTHRYMELIVLRSYATCTYYIVLVYRIDTLYESIWFHTWYSHTRISPLPRS